MYRYAVDDLKEWFKESDRKPLVLRGARQVGKSTVVRLLANELDLDLIEINLEKFKFKSLKDQEINLDEIIEEIELRFKKSITSKSLVFFDEIQDQPSLITALRYFYEEKPEIAVIAAGSLLEFALNEDEVSVPVGRVRYYHMGPMSFFEFLLALGEERLYKTLVENKNISKVAHERLLILLTNFIFIGGMPKAVQTYIKSKDFKKTRQVQKEILELYRDDFYKYTKGKGVLRVQAVFDYVPFHLGQKVKYSEIDSNEKSRDLKIAKELLVFSKVILPIYHSNCSGLPLSAQRDDAIFKFFFLDVGLACAAQEIDIQTIKDGEYLTKGSLVEQLVIQLLWTSRTKPFINDVYYWLKDKDTQKAEIDFVIQDKGMIYPIEVKSEKNGRLRSLFQFIAEKKLSSGIKISTEQFSISEIKTKVQTAHGQEDIKFKLHSIPIYLTENLTNFLAKNKRETEKGFSLIAFLVVMMGIAMVGTSYYLTLTPLSSGRELEVTNKRLSELKRAARNYLNTTGRVPPNSAALLTNTQSIPTCTVNKIPASSLFRKSMGWCGPYIDMPSFGNDQTSYGLDGWGNAFVFSLTTATITSNGPTVGVGDEISVSY